MIITFFSLYSRVSPRLMLSTKSIGHHLLIFIISLKRVRKFKSYRLLCFVRFVAYFSKLWRPPSMDLCWFSSSTSSRVLSLPRLEPLCTLLLPWIKELKLRFESHCCEESNVLEFSKGLFFMEWYWPPAGFVIEVLSTKGHPTSLVKKSAVRSLTDPKGTLLW